MSTPTVAPRKSAPVLLASPIGRLRMLADLVRLAASAVAVAPLPCAASAAVSLATGLLVPVKLWLTMLVVNALASQVRTGRPHGLALWLGLLVACLLADRALGGLQNWVRVVAGERIGPAAQERVMRRAAGHDLAALEHRAYHDRIGRVLGDAEGRVPGSMQALLDLIQTLPPFLGYAAALAIVSPPLLAAVLGATVPTVLAWMVIGQRDWGVRAGFTRDRRLADYYAGILTGRGFAKEVRLYGLGPHVLDRWAQWYWRTRNGWRRQVLRSDAGLRAAGAASTGVSVLALWLVVTHGLHHATAGTYTLLFQSVEGLFGGTFALGNSLRAVGEQSGYASEHRAFVQGGDPPTPRRPRPFPRPLRRGIDFEDVWFTYPGAAEPALAGLNLHLLAGECVALVGENGSGKTTLTKTLLGLYRPDAGRVAFDGVDAVEIDPAELRGALSAVFQQFVRYHLTLGENVALGRIEALGDEANIRDAMARAGADDVLQALAGTETQLGPDVGGVDLSGGEVGTNTDIGWRSRDGLERQAFSGVRMGDHTCLKVTRADNQMSATVSARGGPGHLPLRPLRRAS